MPLIGPEGREQLKVASRVGAVGLEMGIAVLVGVYGGTWLDGKLGTTPWLKWIGLIAGIGAAFRGLYRVARTTKLDKL